MRIEITAHLRQLIHITREVIHKLTYLVNKRRNNQSYQESEDDKHKQIHQHDRARSREFLRLQPFDDRAQGSRDNDSQERQHDDIPDHIQQSQAQKHESGSYEQFRPDFDLLIGSHRCISIIFVVYSFCRVRNIFLLKNFLRTRPVGLRDTLAKRVHAKNISSN